MLRTKQRRLVFVVAPIVFLCLVLFVTLPEGPPVAVAADGRRITIEKITFGTHHSFTQGKWWVRLLKPILGKRWAAQRGCYETRITNDLPALTVWTRWENIDNARPVGIEATILDQRGMESELILYRWHWSKVPHPADPRPYEARVAWLASNYPRRSKALRLRVYDRDRRDAPTQAMEIAFSNPASRRFRDWNGSELPVVITTNNAQFALTSVQRASNALWSFNFVVRTNGQPDHSWIAGGITASSASGNVFSTRSNLAANVTTNIAFQLRGAFWPEEPVWRFAVEFFRVADFQPKETWTLKNIPIPTRTRPHQFTTNLISHGNWPAEFKLESIPLGVPSRPQGIRRNANVHIHFGAPGWHVFLAEATDDQGRQIRVEVDPGAARMVYQFGLAIPAGARSVNLKFAVCQPTIITFGVTGQSFTRAARE